MCRLKEAEEQYKLAVNADPNFAAAYNNYGVLLESRGHKEEAKKQYKLALEANPKYAAAYFN
jgi:Tfp pilus assembly protein PilF